MKTLPGSIQPPPRSGRERRPEQPEHSGTIVDNYRPRPCPSPCLNSGYPASNTTFRAAASASNPPRPRREAAARAPFSMNTTVLRTSLRVGRQGPLAGRRTSASVEDRSSSRHGARLGRYGPSGPARGTEADGYVWPRSDDGPLLTIGHPSGGQAGDTPKLAKRAWTNAADPARSTLAGSAVWSRPTICSVMATAARIRSTSAADLRPRNLASSGGAGQAVQVGRAAQQLFRSNQWPCVRPSAVTSSRL